MIPTSIVSRRVYGRFRELEVDDFAIRRDGGVAMMEGEEVRMACEERGMDVMGKRVEDLRGDLKQWIERRGKT